MADETITLDELAGALREHLRYHREGLVVMTSPEQAAGDLFGIARRQRGDVAMSEHERSQPS